MQYMYTGVVLGNEQSAINYLAEAGLVCLNVDQKADWELDFNYQDDKYNISFDIPSLKQEDYEETIQIADFFIYFLNPNLKQELEIFNEIHKIIQQTKHMLRGFVIFRDDQALIKKNSMDLLADFWKKYPYEAIISNTASFNQLEELIFLMSQALREDKIVVNPQTAWLQEMLLKKEIADKFRNSQWKDVAFLLEKLTTILKLKNDQEWQIWAEITAKIYSKTEDFIKASKIVEDFNPVFTKTYKNQYFSNLLEKADALFKAKNFTDAANKYEFAARWAQFELEDTKLKRKAFYNAIICWIKAVEIQNVLAIIDQLDHSYKIFVMENIVESIITKVENLEENQEYNLAKAQMYLCFQRYQKMGLFDSLKLLTNKTVLILKKNIELQLKKGNFNTAQLTLDELENIWESYDIKKSNIDNILYQLGILYLENSDFQKVDLILPKLESTKLKNDLTDLRVKKEDFLKNAKKVDKLSHINASLAILTKYIDYENQIFQSRVDKILNEVEKMLNENKLTFALGKLNNEYEWFNKMKKFEESKPITMKILDIHLKMKEPLVFLKNFNDLPEMVQKEYIKKRHQYILKSFKVFENSIPQNQYIEGLFAIIKEYRNHLLYEEAKLFAELLINYLYQCAMDAVQEPNIKKIEYALQQISQIQQIIGSNFTKYSINFDKVYGNIVKFYLEQLNFQSARKYNQKIENLDIANMYNEQIEELESKKSQKQLDIAISKHHTKITVEKLSQLRNQARDQNITSENMYRMRVGLKRRYFDPILDLLAKNKFSEASHEYFQVAQILGKTKKYQLSGLCASLGGLLLLIIKETDSLQSKINELRSSLNQSESYLNQTFPMKILDYMIEMIEINNKVNFLEALKLYKNLPLFPEEQTIIETIIGNPIDFKIILKENIGKESGSLAEDIPNNVGMLLSGINIEKSVIDKRNDLEDRYWGECRDYFTQQNYNAASMTYLKYVKELITRKTTNLAITSIIMSFLSAIQNKSISTVYQEFEKFIFKLEKIDFQISKSPIINLLDLLLQYWENSKAKTMIQQIIIGLRDKLPLFAWEKSYFNRLLNSIENESNQTTDVGDLKTEIGEVQSEHQDTLLLQQANVLLDIIKANQNEFINIKEKRSKMIRTYYAEIFQSLIEKKYENASKMYLRLAKRMARRNDYVTSSLMILCSILVQNQLKISLKNTKSQLDEFLSKLGIIKNILYDQIGVKVSYFLIDALGYKEEVIEQKILEILSLLPFLDEEKMIFP